MEELFTVSIGKINLKLNECDETTQETLVLVQNGIDSIELTIESPEPDSLDEEYQKPNYIVWVTNDEETVDQLVNPYDFENANSTERIRLCIDLFMERCNLGVVNNEI